MNIKGSTISHMAAVHPGHSYREPYRKKKKKNINEKKPIHSYCLPYLQIKLWKNQTFLLTCLLFGSGEVDFEKQL